jgi:tetratricopeptide (TPR) repeat protein
MPDFVPDHTQSDAHPPRDLFLVGTLVMVTAAIYAQVWGHQFINFDDPRYIYENPAVRAGLTLRGIAWAFLTFNGANWHPLTWIAHMIDWQIFGANAGGHLLVDAALHAANAALVFWFLRRATGKAWPSAIVAALFAWHPLHVESVAWAAERKDTLATFFGLLALIAYVRYAERTSWKRYAVVAALFACGLMAKPMLVTWPFVMLLLDYWPLGRFQRPGNNKSAIAKLVIEKLPLLLLVALSAFITLLAQAQGHAIRPVAGVSLSFRICNAAVAYTKYLVLTFWPHDLAPYYPLTSIQLWDAIFAAAGLAGITLVCFAGRKSRPYLLIGWLWFVGTLVPVIGLVQVGDQAFADRYHYIPSIGLFTAVVFGLADISARHHFLARVAPAVTAVVLVVLAGLTFRQIRFWRNSITLFEHTLQVSPRSNLPIRYNLALALDDAGRPDEAATHLEKALEMNPKFAPALYKMGMIRQGQNRMTEALTFYERAVRARPDMPQAHIGLGMWLVTQDRIKEAVPEFQEAARLDPWSAEARNDLGLALAKTGKTDDAIEVLREALRLEPESAEAHNNLGSVLLSIGQTRESIVEFEAALRSQPSLESARRNLERARAKMAESGQR